MFNKIGPTEILVILAVALLIFGPAKLPQLGRSMGETIKEFKKSMKGVREEIEAEPTESTKKDPEKQDSDKQA